MTTIATQVDNANNNGNQWRHMIWEHIKVPRGGNNRVIVAENPSSGEEEFYEEKLAIHVNRWDNHDYWVKDDISLLYGMWEVDEFVD